MCAQSFSHVQLFATSWTITHQAPLSIGFFRLEYWSGLPFPSPGALPYQRLNLGLLHCRQILYHLSHQGSPQRIADQWLIQDLNLSLLLFPLHPWLQLESPKDPYKITNVLQECVSCGIWSTLILENYLLCIGGSHLTECRILYLVSLGVGKWVHHTEFLN